MAVPAPWTPPSPVDVLVIHRPTVHFVHPGNPSSHDPDGIVSVQRNFAAAAPDDFAFRYWGVGRPGLGGPVQAGRIRFRSVVSSLTQRPRVPLSLRFAAGSLRGRGRPEAGILRFDRMESALPFLSSPLPKVLFLHIWDLADIVGPHSDSRWRRFGSFYDRVLDTVVRRMDRVYVLRPDVGDHLARRVPGSEVTLRPFEVPVDVSMFRLTTGSAREEARADLCRRHAIPEHARIVVFAGRLESVKRPLVIPEIAQAMAGDSRPVHFVIAGTGSLQTGMERAVEAACPGRVHFLGPLPQNRLARVFGAADACLLPSGFEGLPNVVLESLACGTPVVASSSAGGVADLLAGRTIGAMASGDPGSFADALRAVFAWEGSRAGACRDAALAFAPETLNASIYEDLRSLIGSEDPLALAGAA